MIWVLLKPCYIDGITEEGLNSILSEPDFRDAFAVFSYIRIQSFISHKIGKSLLGGEVAVEGRSEW